MNLRKGFLRLTIVLSIIMGFVGFLSDDGNILLGICFAGGVWILYAFIRYVVTGFIGGDYESLLSEVKRNKKNIMIFISLIILLLCVMMVLSLSEKKKRIQMQSLPQYDMLPPPPEPVYVYEYEDSLDYMTDK